MDKTYNIYIDESCHLENDDSEVMCIGYTKVSQDNYEDLKRVLKSIKFTHRNPMEFKWNKLSMSRWDLYKELVDFFFRSDIEFRSVLIKKKKNLGSARYNREDQNSYYYKTLKILLNDKSSHDSDIYRVYLDVKDTRGKTRLDLLEKELNIIYNNNPPFKHFQHIHSNESEFLQLTDFFIGAICYKARKEHLKDNASPVKKKIIDYIEDVSGYLLDDGTEPWDTKFFIHDFQIKPISND
ncbi:DUF3800 domain-containing protein [uncultured Algibacter sp.]|uniref:DUF3800 domain-containing protein n=1 Tax=uncultured Algibacter sp. TaxID=298659 RepID=UPI00262B3EBF|nr:DUF3800 domain-containing protein [uncultured Algibacter sp.]